MSITNLQRHLLDVAASARMHCLEQAGSKCCGYIDEYLAHVFASLGDDKQVTQKALQTVVAGQQAENLLNFDDPMADDQQPSGIAATAALAATPAAASLLSGTSSNPLDDLVSIFGNVSMGSAAPAPQQNGLGGLGGLSFGTTPMAPSPATPSVLQAASPPPAQPQQAHDDLLGLF